MKVLISFEDQHGKMDNEDIVKYNADPLDVVDQYANGHMIMFSSILDDEGIPDYDNKLQHISGIVIDLDGNTTGEYIGDFDMGMFDERINNLINAVSLDIVDTPYKDLNVGDVIIDVTDFTVRTFNG